jgi:hypothetical protein
VAKARGVIVPKMKRGMARTQPTAWTNFFILFLFFISVFLFGNYINIPENQAFVNLGEVRKVGINVFPPRRTGEFIAGWVAFI